MGRRGLTGLLTAVPFESDRMIRMMARRKRVVLRRQGFSAGRIVDADVVHMTSGIGIANAAHAATAMILGFRPSRIVLFGVGGAYASSGLSVGDVAVATQEVYGDTGVATAHGIAGMEEIGIPLLRRGGKDVFNQFLLDRRLAALAVRAAEHAAGDRFSVLSGAFVTVSACSGTRQRSALLGKRHHAVCENMEGAAVAQVCARYGVPLVEVRGISNIAGIRDKKKWDLRLASDTCQEAVGAVLRSIRP